MTDFEALQQLCNTADQLSNRYTSASSPDFKAWKTKADRLLIRRFGEDSYEFKSFNKISYSAHLTQRSLKLAQAACERRRPYLKHTSMNFRTKRSLHR